MKLYRCTKNDAGLGTLLSWHASKREVRRHQKERADQACGPECVAVVDVLTVWMWVALNFVACAPALALFLLAAPEGPNV